MHETSRNAGITVGELREQLAIFDQNAELHMNGLQFYRLKRRGDTVVQLEFNQFPTQLADGRWVIEIAPAEFTDVP